MLTEMQKRTIQAIVNVFETGKPIGNYGKVTFRGNDVGCLTYGRSQTTLSSGGLALLIQQYCDAPGATLTEKLRPYLVRLKTRDRSLDADAQFRSLLRRAGTDPAMRQAEDRFFDRAYWDPALSAARALGLHTALGTAVVYDSFIHGAWARLRNMTIARAGLPSAASAEEGLPTAPDGHVAGTGECEWVRAYVAVRRDWLATHANRLLRRTVYRMETFAALVAAANWNLDLPLIAHGVLLDKQSVAGDDAATLAALSVATGQEAHSEKDA